jgi:hypothetical protein
MYHHHNHQLAWVLGLFNDAFATTWVIQWHMTAYDHYWSGSCYAIFKYICPIYFLENVRKTMKNLRQDSQL